MIPYGRHSINDDDIAAVVAALNSDWLTTGPLVEEFEEALEKVLVSHSYIDELLIKELNQKYYLLKNRVFDAT